MRWPLPCLATRGPAHRRHARRLRGGHGEGHRRELGPRLLGGRLQRSARAASAGDQHPGGGVAVDVMGGRVWARWMRLIGADRNHHLKEMEINI